MTEIRVLDGETARAHVPALAAVLLDCVEGGASVGFMSSLAPESAREFFDSVCDEVARAGGCCSRPRALPRRRAVCHDDLYKQL